ncbi:hypothetical protein [Pontiella agarivorans]|uniref:Uncharacterized protein n=1 Tax=Pontiella agarivorans TaxID=3038953 RepID=A0ABU5MZG0_9BACT|nr:hypothetical protein [Pontiella agarivorans]MDZ8119491.1 hypothetical protein [Pontiella agarivorans]
MKTNVMKERESDRTAGDAITFGALLLAPAVGLIVALIMHRIIDARFSEVLFMSLLAVAPICIVGELIRWTVQVRNPMRKRIGYDRRQPERLPHFVPPGLQSRSRNR